MLSYGWNDICRFVSTGRIHGGTEREKLQYHGSEDADEDMVSADTPTSTPATPVFQSTPASQVVDEDFTTLEWRTMALGWRDFQHDLRYAAQSGVRVWRMKVCVLTSGS